MATKHSRSAARLMMAPAVILLLGWMLVPLIMTLMFSFKQYLPLRGGDLGWVGFDNYVRFVTSSAFWPSVLATLVIVGGVLIITVVLGVLLAILLNQPMWGRGIVRILVIAPFFVMPTVSALVWKNMFMDPVNGLFAHLWKFFGAHVRHPAMRKVLPVLSSLAALGATAQLAAVAPAFAPSAIEDAKAHRLVPLVSGACIMRDEITDLAIVELPVGSLGRDDYAEDVTIGAATGNSNTRGHRRSRPAFATDLSDLRFL